MNQTADRQEPDRRLARTTDTPAFGPRDAARAGLFRAPLARQALRGIWTLGWILLGLSAIGLPDAVLAQADDSSHRSQNTSSVDRVLRIESIDFEGLVRTPAATARTATRLAPGDPLSLTELARAEERLIASRLFRTVRSRTKRGSAPGKVDVLFEVEEARPEFRFGLGHHDLTGWYLVPIELNLDNLSGRGERFSLSSRIGLRTAGLFVTWRRPSLEDPRHYWEVALRSEFEDRLYFYENVEVNHRVRGGGLDFALGRPLNRHWETRTWLSFEGVDVDSTAKVHRTDLARDRRQGDLLDFVDLPEEVRGGVDKHPRTQLGLSLTRDTRRGAGLEVRGAWARGQGKWIGGQEIASFGVGDFDVRTYVPLRAGTQLALRLHGQTTSRHTPFYERPYLGGLYTVRGYPSQALSPPEGDRHTVTTGFELRGAWIGQPSDPRLVGLLFLDAGWGWQSTPETTRGAIGAGYGIRLALPWIGRLGIDVGHPLSDAPIDDSFHINAGLGWTF